MAETIEYKPELGNVEAFRALAKKRLENAELDYKRTVGKNLSQEVVEVARRRLDACTAEYEAFVKGLPKDSKDPNELISENKLH